MLVDFQGFQLASLTDIDLFNCKQQIKEPLSQYFKRFIQIKAQIPNIPAEMVIIAAIKGFQVGQCASHLAREKPSIVASFTKTFKNITSQMTTTEKESKKKITLGLKSSKTTTSILQNQTTMSEDYLHHTIKSIKLRMTIIQQPKVIMLTKINITSEVNSMKEHLKEEALPQEEEEEAKHL